jgi:HYR domain
MSADPRSLAAVRVLFATSLLLVPLSETGSAQQIAVGANINMVGGPASLSPGPPFTITGDPYLQRQNEPSMACSSRNPVNCLAAANDYRLVGTPGVQDGKVTGDAWLGVFWTHDEGQTWRSTLLPGFPQDTSADGLASPITGLGAAADPTVRAGTNGLLYVSGIAFNRSNESSSNGGKTGSFFASLYIDDNNTQTAGSPIRYVRTVVIDNGNNGQFLDKPWIAVDIPRAGAGTCTIPGSGGVPDQIVPAGAVYAAYSVFLGNSNPHTKILFTRSTDCGQTWSNPTKLNESYGIISQSPVIAVNPVNGNVLVAWRQFGDPNFQDPGAVMVAQSSDMGNTFPKAATVATLGLANPTPITSSSTLTSLAFDQPSLPVVGDTSPTMRMFRTNGYPSACIGTDGIYRVAWSQRVPTPAGDSRIMISTSPDGMTWSAPAPVDPYPYRGHQFMPSIACTANRATLLWYDQRYDNAPAVFGSIWFGFFIFDPIPPPPSHTIDVRAAQSDPSDATGETFLPSTQVSRYQWAVDTTPNPSTPSGINGLVQLEFNPVNWPLFAGGQIPFLGDYIDLAPARTFNPPVGTSSGWTYDADPNDTGVLHAAWTDNRDIVQPSPSTDWTAWAPPTASTCDPTTVSNRNQNVYTARLSRGLMVGVEGNSRLVAATSGPTLRAFAVFVKNATTVTRSFRFDTGVAPGGTAWFDAGQTLTSLAANIGPLSTIARTVFVPATQAVPVVVAVTEVDSTGATLAGGLSGSALVNSDGTAPPPIDGSVATVELHTPLMSDPLVTSYANPVYQNPTFINPTFINPTFINPTFINPTFINPTFINPTFINPTFINPTFINPTFINPTFINPTFINQPVATDVTWQVTNTGNVASGFNFGAIAAWLPTNASFQLIINRLYSTPGSNNCGLGQQLNADLQAVINNPVLQSASGGNPLSPDVTNATFALAAGDSALVTLRVFHDGTFDPSAVAARTVSQAANSDGSVSAAPSAPAIHAPTGGVTVQATGPTGATATFTVTADSATGSSLPVTCLPASGALFAIGSTTVTCSATDPASSKTSTVSFLVVVVDTTPPVVTVPGPITAEATSGAGAKVTFTGVSATDIVDGTIATVTCVPPSGSTFPLGATSVTCSATDSHGNTGTASFTVTVRDTTPPVVTVPGPITAEATSPAGAVVNYSGVSAVDLVDGSVPVTCKPASGSVFPFGTTVVTCTATDAHGNTGSASFTVKVQDTTPPAVTATAAPNTLLWSPNKTMTPVVITGTVTDASPVTASFSVLDEYGTVQPSGTITLNANGSYSFTVYLQAWRAGTDSDGRLYVVTVTAKDAWGNVGSASTNVTVPHN